MKKISTIFLALSLLAVSCNKSYNNQANFGVPKKTNDPALAGQPIAKIDQETGDLVIFLPNKPTKIVKVSQVPIFNDDIIKKHHYTFYSNTFSGGPEPIFDSVKNKIYVVVEDDYSAGNLNRDNRGLFAYDIIADKFSLLEREVSFKYSFEKLLISPAGHLLIYDTWGSLFEGSCGPDEALKVYDLRKQKIVKVLMPPQNANLYGTVTFLKWTNGDSFQYQEKVFKNDQDCEDDKNATTQIKQASL